MKTCYYELLEVEATATDAEIKKAYRRKALQLHPDKNPHDVEGANARFTLVRAAYEVLSDAQERSWYDSHKSQILRDDDDEPSSAGTGVEMVYPSISIDELLWYFNPTLYTAMDDTLVGFYTVVGRLFERLAAEEVTHGKSQQLDGYSRYRDDANDVSALDSSLLLYPRFGNSHSDYESVTREFYSRWGTFLSVKSFSWLDQYRYSDAPDRQIKRLMVKENKKARDTGRKEYNETVRKFVSFVKRRDPRVKEGVEKLERRRRRQQEEALQRQAQEQKLQKMAESVLYTAPDWATMDSAELEEVEAMLREEYEFLSDATTDSEFDEFADQEDDALFECIVCDKMFKSKNQFDAHEITNKHKNMVKILREEMRQEGLELGFDEGDADVDAGGAGGAFGDDVSPSSDLSDYATAPSEELSDNDSFNMEFENQSIEKELEELEKELGEKKEESEGMDTRESEVDFNELEIDDIIDEEEIELPQRSKKKQKKKYTLAPITEVNEGPLDAQLSELMGDVTLDKDSDEDWGSNKKKKKKKPKREIGNSSPSPAPPVTKPDPTPAPKGEICLTCKQEFSSRNKMFQHVQKTGHGVPIKEKKSKKRK